MLAGASKLTVLDLRELEVLFPCLWCGSFCATQKVAVLIPAVLALTTALLCLTLARTNHIMSFQNNKMFTYRIFG